MQNVILDIAKQAIHDSFNHTSTIDTKALLECYPELSKPKATFVTLTLDHQLRGCIGSLIAHRPLLDDLIHNAQAAAFEDPRFYPLSPEEFSRVHIEVSLLSEPEVVVYSDIEDLKSKVTVGVDGIILQRGSRKATFLPQVWEQLPTFELFFSHLCQKAGLESGCLESHPDIWHYRVEKVK
ncbi:AmmeMemoRadiSam system protein A [Sulfurospirillum oryzae]|uniref:AmmeMemoRadiSam system protein A n=1 Tax=Sulfurospirillum oryzae TaxID=2976535 RepID=UPI0021E89B7E|nr:AmmeMemoRadiSam system protein A [Sulfurospirillum oryzae]